MSESELPYWDPEQREFIVQRTDKWVVTVTPMLFNERVCLATHDEHGSFYTAGFCYDKGAAVAAALIWDPQTEQRPTGFKKIAFDSRRPTNPSKSQPFCRWCWGDLHPDRIPDRGEGEREACCICGTVTEEGIYSRVDPDSVRYPRESQGVDELPKQEG